MLLTLLACSTTPPDELGGGGEDTGPEPRSYACGWQATDPGDLEATGADEGDVVADWTATDQCGDEVHLWDGYGRLTLVMAPPFW